MVKQYNKLVRDRIPEIIEASGNKCVIAILSDADYKNQLDKKLNEECEEYQVDKSIEELADIMEVVYAIAQEKGISVDELEKVRIKKATERGTFKNKILLIQTEELKS